MDLSRREEFRSCSRDLSDGKDQFCFFYPKQILIEIGPSYRFIPFPSAVLLLQNLLPTTTDHHYPVSPVHSKPSKFTTAKATS